MKRHQFYMRFFNTLSDSPGATSKAVAIGPCLSVRWSHDGLAVQFPDSEEPVIVADHSASADCVDWKLKHAYGAFQSATFSNFEIETADPKDLVDSILSYDAFVRGEAIDADKVHPAAMEYLQRLRRGEELRANSTPFAVHHHLKDCGLVTEKKVKSDLRDREHEAVLVLTKAGKTFVAAMP